MNRGPLLVPSIVILAVLLIVGGIFYFSPPLTSNTPAGGTVSTSTSASAPASPSQPSSTKTSSPTGTTRPSAPSGLMTASVKNATIPFTESFTLNLNAGPSCSQLAYLLSFGDNTVPQNIDIPRGSCARPYTTVVSHQYQKAGVFIVTLSVRLAGVGVGATLSQVTITAKNQVVTTGTTPYGTFTTSPVSGNAPLTVDFAVSATDSSEANGIYYTIAFGDGTTATFPRTSAPALSHVFTATGNYGVIVTRRTQCSSGTCSGPSTPLGTIFITVL